MGLFALAAAGGVLYGAYRLIFPDKPKARFVGDHALIGDIVEVAPTFLVGAKPTLPPGTLFVNVKVTAADKDTIRGMIIGFQNVPRIPAEIGPYNVHRSAIYKVTRGNKVIAFQPGAQAQVAGDYY